MHQPRGLLADRLHDLGMAVPDVGDRDAAEQVEVLVALGVPQARARAAHELDGEARVGARQAGPSISCSSARLI